MPEINIFLHGFFFTEVQDGNLVIASPKHWMHKFGFWDHQQNSFLPFPVPPATFSWIPFLRQGQKDDFPTDLLQFSRADLAMPTDQFFITPPAEKYAVYLQLPLPANTTSVRPGGNMKDVDMDKSKVAQSVSQRCGANADLSLITCLTYVISGNPGFTDISFYAEHCGTPNIKQIKALFDDARLVFPYFDLNFTAFNPGKPLPGPGNDENEMKLIEVNGKLQNNPCSPIAQELQELEQKMWAPLLRTANCPQFGIVAA